MIDFKSSAIFKLTPTKNEEGFKLVEPMLVDNENIFASFKTIRDMVVFTNKRAIAINVQGITGKKKDFTSLPYSKIQAFSVETAGTLDIDCEIELWFSGLGKVKFEIVGNFDTRSFNKLLSNYIL